MLILRLAKVIITILILLLVLTNITKMSWAVVLLTELVLALILLLTKVSLTRILIELSVVEVVVISCVVVNNELIAASVVAVIQVLNGHRNILTALYMRLSQLLVVEVLVAIQGSTIVNLLLLLLLLRRNVTKCTALRLDLSELFICGKTSQQLVNIGPLSLVLCKQLTHSLHEKRVTCAVLCVEFAEMLVEFLVV